jgi:hypothetical protein
VQQNSARETPKEVILFQLTIRFLSTTRARLPIQKMKQPDAAKRSGFACTGFQNAAWHYRRFLHALGLTADHALEYKSAAAHYD